MRRLRSVSVVAVLAAGIATGLPVSASASTAAAKVPVCQGRKATIVVTAAHKRVVGTKRNDVIVALGAGDTILGLGGNDRICAGAARSIDGGDGNDTITFWGSGTVHGGKGNDTITQLAVPAAGSEAHADLALKGAGSPKIYGDAGDDTIHLGPGSGKAYGGDGNDTIYGGTGGKQTLDGGNGNDRLKGGKSGTFDLFGGNGNDVLMVIGGSGMLDGQGGSNTLTVPGVLLKKFATVVHADDTLNGVKPTSPAPPVTTPPVTVPPAPPVPPVVPTGPSTVLTGDGQLSSDAVSIYGSGPGSAAGVTFGSAAAEVTPGVSVSTWQLDFGDRSPVHAGDGVPQSSIFHRYLGPAAYTAVLTVTNSAGQVATSSVAVSVADAPTVRLPAGSLAGRTLTVHPSVTAGAGATVDSYSLFWGDGTEAMDMTAPPSSLTHTYAGDGLYFPFLEVQDDHGALSYNTLTTGEEVEATGKGAANIATENDGQALIAAGSTQLVTSESAYGESYSYYAFDSSICPSATVPPTYSVSVDGAAADSLGSDAFLSKQWSTGAHTLTLELFCRGALTATTSINVDAEPAAVIDGVGPAASSVAVGQPVTLVDSVFAPARAQITSYELSWGDGTSTVGTGPTVPSSLTHTYAAAGYYYLSLSIADSYGGTDTYFNVTVEVTSDVPTFTLEGENGSYYQAVSGWLGTTASTELNETTGRHEESDTYLDAGSVIPATGHTLASFDLNFGDSTPDYAGTFTDDQQTLGSVSREHAYVTSGDHTAVLTVRQDDGSTFTRTLTVNVVTVPVLTLTVSNPAPIVGQPVTVTPTVVGGGIADSWDSYDSGKATTTDAQGGNGLPSAVTYTVTGTGTLTFTVEYDTDHGYVDASVSVPVSS